LHHFSSKGISKRKAQLERCPVGKGQVFFIVTLRRGAASRKIYTCIPSQAGVQRQRRARGEERKKGKGGKGRKEADGGRGLKHRLEGRRRGRAG